MEVVDVLFLITVSVYSRQRFIAVGVSIQETSTVIVLVVFLGGFVLLKPTIVLNKTSIDICYILVSTIFIFIYQSHS